MDAMLLLSICSELRDGGLDTRHRWDRRLQNADVPMQADSLGYYFCYDAGAMTAAAGHKASNEQT